MRNADLLALALINIDILPNLDEVKIESLGFFTNIF